jgi:hypothetical protein
MWPFKRVKRIEDQAQPAEDSQSEEKPDSLQMNNGSGQDSKFFAEIIKLKAEFEQFNELRKVINERFSRFNEQVGELRAMIMDTNRGMEDIEVKTVKAVDLVEAVHPDKLMVEVRRQEAKVEALRASIESNEVMMKSILDQLKELRHQMSVFRGLDQVIHLSNETKKELTSIKKVQATVERHADKVEGIFVESQKRFQDLEKIEGRIDALDKHAGQLTEQLDQTRIRVATLANKKDVDDMVKRLSDFEKHVGNVIDLIAKRANDLPKDINERFSKMETSMNGAFEGRLKRAERTNDIINRIEKRAPEIAQKLRLSDIIEKGNSDDESLPKKAISSGESVLKESEKELKQEHKSLLDTVFRKEGPKK